MNLKKRGYCLLLILSLQLAFLFAFNDNPSKGFIILGNEIIYDFESSLEEWEPSLLTEGSVFELTNVDPFEGYSSAKLVGRTRYYQPIANYVTLNLTPSTIMNFSWKYDNIDGYYFGILLACEGPDIWFMHKFSGTYANNSNYLVVEYIAENIGEWYSHSVNIYDLYMDYYGYLPTKITSVHVYNRGYGAATGTTPSSQISYYDSIKIGDLDITIPPSSKPEISLL